jgi:peptide/nickel transport system permease protein
MAGAIIIFVIIACAMAAPILAPYNYAQIDLTAIERPPSAEHLLGTDSAGRDVLSRLIYGAQVSVTVGLAAALSAGVIGLILGLVAGYLRGAVDAIIMRVVDIFLSFPSLIVIILLVSIAGPSLATVVIAIALFEWPTTCRVVRQMTVSLREREYVKAARSMGASHARVLWKHLMLGVVSPLTVAMTTLSAQAILLEAALSFLGLGVAEPIASWGGMLQRAQSLTVLQFMPWLWLAPGIAIAMTVLAINFVGDGLRDAFDSRQV